MIGLDTSFVIDFLKGRPEALEIASKMENQGFVVAPITIYEVLFGIYSIDTKADSEERALEFFDRVETIPITPLSAKQGAKIAASLKRVGDSIPTTDALIASAVMFHGCQSIISSDKDFTRIKGLKVIVY